MPYQTHLDQELCEELSKLAETIDIPALKGKTVGTNDFYEGTAVPR